MGIKRFFARFRNNRKSRTYIVVSDQGGTIVTTASGKVDICQELSNGGVTQRVHAGRRSRSIVAGGNVYITRD